MLDPLIQTIIDRESGQGGAGLGLAIVKFCIQASRGTATAANRETHGLVVKMELRASPPQDSGKA